MVSQIIFFVAVALLIILLARRIYVRSFSGRVGSALYDSFRGAGGFFVRIWRSIESLISRRQPKSPSFGIPTQAQNDSGHHFWRDEPMSEKSELASHFEEGDMLFKEKKYPEAEQFFLKAAATNPKDPKVYARLGLIYLQQKNYSDAIEALKMAAKLDQFNPSRHYNIALAYMGNKDTQKAIASAREAITLDPVTQKYRQLLEKLLNG